MTDPIENKFNELFPKVRKLGYCEKCVQMTNHINGQCLKCVAIKTDESTMTDAPTAKEDISKVDRFEVIDDTGRAYVKGSIYDTPVSVELSYQDDGRTLKVFVSPREPNE